LAAAILCSVPSLAANGDVIATRVAGFKQLGSAYKAVNDQLRGGSPQLDVVRRNAEQIRSIAGEQFRWFPAGSGPAPGRTTRAKQEIWSQRSGFQAAQNALAGRANDLASATRGNDISRIQAAAQELGRTCQACHRQYREDR
jgi:cytochrome c556